MFHKSLQDLPKFLETAESHLIFEEHLTQSPDGRTVAEAPTYSLKTDFEPGAKKTTGRKLDLAIGGDGFFVFENESGEMYSKNGVLFRDPDGKLVNSDGMALLDDGQPIQIPPEVSDRQIMISAGGQISANGNVLGKVSLVQFDDPHLLEASSQVYFRIGEATASPAEDTTIMQGMREMANAHPVNELISLIVGSRGFEQAQRAIRTLSDSLQQNIRS